MPTAPNTKRWQKKNKKLHTNEWYESVNYKVLKVCSKCKEQKELNSFAKIRAAKDGFFGYCKKCDVDRNPRQRKRYFLKSKYGLSLEEYDLRLELQNNLCLICEKEFDVINVDHCHKTGRVRGLLCRKCNLALGYMRDNPNLPDRLFGYMTD